jgi:glycosyltransferase involved in cell wall biosynthesis
VHRLYTNYGRPHVARNYGVEKAKGDFIAFLDDDDFNHPDRLERSLEVFQRYPEVDVVVSSFEMQWVDTDHRRDIY